MKITWKNHMKFMFFISLESLIHQIIFTDVRTCICFCGLHVFLPTFFNCLLTQLQKEIEINRSSKSNTRFWKITGKNHMFFFISLESLIHQIIVTFVKTHMFLWFACVSFLHFSIVF